jgi:hypothetical protein
MLAPILAGAALAALGIAAADAASLLDTKTPYAADVSITVVGGGAQTTAGHIYGVPGMTRLEQDPAADGAAKSIIITRHDRNVSYLLDPAKHAYVELPIRPGLWDDRTLKLTPEGSDPVGGIPATRAHVEGEIGPGVHGEGAIWRTPDSIVVKAEMTGKPKQAGLQGMSIHTTYQLSNLHRGAQDPALFEVPSGWTRQEVPGIAGKPNSATPQ